MLVEINLLPQKERKKFTFYMVLAGFLALFLLTGVYYFFQINSMKKNIESVDREIAMTQKISEKEEAKIQNVESSSSVTQLKNAIDWANTYSIQTIPVMRHLTSILPERGFIQSFSYTEAGTINLTVQFDSPREAAYFLNNLNESKWISDAKLSSLNPAAQAETTTTVTTVDEAATNTGIQPNTANTASGAAAQDGTDSPTDVVNAGTNNNAAVSQTSNTANTLTSPYLPRYTGQFEITFNKDEIKQDINVRKTGEKGVSGS
ncbi:PilN domain-containing protein [Neobacillus sp. 114]|uniref:PilN domain-containing protein n=1 Tax=Neobacillus sp. 114 TaxID=3048535 RepID=UPI0024C2C3FD|nr:PilN domain-containing protein [Neobacillus sp. 114]